MNKLLSFISIGLFVVVISACSELSSLSGLSVSQPTNTEIVGAFKEALTIGVNKGVSKLSANNGYYNDLAVRIGLPEEALVITKNISKLPGGEKLVNDVIQRINAAATDAAKEAAPIFIGAITSMSFTDVANILKGNNTAATTYFKSKTKTSLKALYASKIQTSLDKKIVGDISASSSWNTLTSKWNSVANTLVGKAAGLTPVNTNLTDYLTDKAVDGMYQKVGEQETAIRTKASERTSALLKKVFGR